MIELQTNAHLQALHMSWMHQGTVYGPARMLSYGIWFSNPSGLLCKCVYGRFLDRAPCTAHSRGTRGSRLACSTPTTHSCPSPSSSRCACRCLCPWVTPGLPTMLVSAIPKVLTCNANILFCRDISSKAGLGHSTHLPRPTRLH